MGVRFTAAAYARQLKALMPRGAALNVEINSVLSGVVLGMAQEAARVDQRASDLLDESDPRTIRETLPEWEAMLGLPDPCVGVDQTIAQRVAAVVSKYVATGGQSPAYFIEVAAAAGYVITIAEFRAHTVESDVETPLYGDDFAYTWQVNAPLNTVEEMTVDSDADAPFAWWGNALLECLLGRLAPAHTVVKFSYS